MPIGGRLPRGVRIVQLPPIRVSDGELSSRCAMPRADRSTTPIGALRRDLLLAAYECRGARASSSSRRSRSGGGRCTSSSCRCSSASNRRADGRWSSRSVRDILQQRGKPEREREMLGCGDSAGSTPCSSTATAASPASTTRFRSRAELGLPVHYTGFVADAEGDCRHRTSRRTERNRRLGGRRGCRHRAARGSARWRSSDRGSATCTWRVSGRPQHSRMPIFEHLLRAARALARSSSGRATTFPALLGRRSSRCRRRATTRCSTWSRSGARPVVVPFAEDGRNRAAHAREPPARSGPRPSSSTNARLRRKRSRGAIDAAGSREHVGALGFRLRWRRAFGSARDRGASTGHVRAQGPARRRERAVTDWRPPRSRARRVARQPAGARRCGGATTTRAATRPRCGGSSGSPMRHRECRSRSPSSRPRLEPSLVDAVAESRNRDGRPARLRAPQPCAARRAQLGARRASTGGRRSSPSCAKAAACSRAPSASASPQCWSRRGIGSTPDVVSRICPTPAFTACRRSDRARPSARSPALMQCNTHVDLIAWRADRAFVGRRYGDRAVWCDHLRARREGDAPIRRSRPGFSRTISISTPPDGTSSPTSSPARASTAR